IIFATNVMQYLDAQGQKNAFNTMLRATDKNSLVVTTPHQTCPIPIQFCAYAYHNKYAPESQAYVLQQSDSGRQIFLHACLTQHGQAEMTKRRGYARHALIELPYICDLRDHGK